MPTSLRIAVVLVAVLALAYPNGASWLWVTAAAVALAVGWQVHALRGGLAVALSADLAAFPSVSAIVWSCR